MRLKRGMKMRRPHLKLIYVLVPEEELQTSYDMLLHIHLGRPPFNLAVDAFLSVTEALVEHYSPPYQGGRHLDKRRDLR